MKNKKNKVGDLRVWWIPQVPMKSFDVPVNNLVEAKLILNTLADYDLFQLDYANAGGLQIYSDVNGDGTEFDWWDWEDDEGNGIDDYSLDDLREDWVKQYNDKERVLKD